MKRYFALLFFVLTACYSHAQYRHPLVIRANSNNYTAIDTANYRFMYSLYSVKNPAKPKDQLKDIQALDIGNKISKYYSWDIFQYLDNRKPVGGAVGNNPHWGSYGYEIFKNYPLNGVMTVTDLGYYGRGILYVYDEPMPQLDWKLHDEYMEILEYKCQKASASFRGRDYTAWFTMGIPISNGPWKFGGLPGLIMKVEDSEQHYVFECIGIENINDPIRFYNAKFEKITRQALNNQYIRFHKDELNTLQMLVLPNTKPIHSDEELPYNPLERDLK